MLLFTQYTVDNNINSTFWIQQDGSLITANCSACTTYGYTLEEIARLTVMDLDHNISAEIWEQQWNLLKQNQKIIQTVTHQTKTGQIIPVEIIATYLEFPESDLCFIQAKDISHQHDGISQSCPLEVVTQNT